MAAGLSGRPVIQNNVSLNLIHSKSYVLNVFARSKQAAHRGIMRQTSILPVALLEPRSPTESVT